MEKLFLIEGARTFRYLPKTEMPFPNKIQMSFCYGQMMQIVKNRHPAKGGGYD